MAGERTQGCGHGSGGIHHRAAYTADFNDTASRVWLPSRCSAASGEAVEALERPLAWTACPGDGLARCRRMTSVA
jgi:hypothetical protein